VVVVGDGSSTTDGAELKQTHCSAADTAVLFIDDDDDDDEGNDDAAR